MAHYIDRGGGTPRRIRFHEKMIGAISSTRRETVSLRGSDEISVEPDGQVIIAAPGGGGFGGNF